MNRSLNRGGGTRARCVPGRPYAALTVAAALLAIAAVLLMTRPAAAEEDPSAPVEVGTPASGFVWSGLGGPDSLPGPVVGEPATPPAPAPVREPEGPSAEGGATEAPEKKTLSVTIPRLGLKDVWMPNSRSQYVLDRHGVMRFAGTGFPWQPQSNTYLAGHAEGYAGGRVPHAFRDLHKLRDGDRVVLEDADGETYAYEVYKSIVVGPSDVWVTQPLPGKKVVTLQTCWPAPTYEKRLIVRAKFVG